MDFTMHTPSRFNTSISFMLLCSGLVACAQEATDFVSLDGYSGHQSLPDGLEAQLEVSLQGLVSDFEDPAALTYNLKGYNVDPL